MRLEQPFIRLALTADAQALAREVDALPPDAWHRHPQAFAGNSYLPLAIGAGSEGSFVPPIAATDSLARCPYVQQVLAAFETVLGRVRLMRIEPGSSVPEHVDTHHYWRRRVRVHVPIITDSAVTFRCGGTTLHMAPGEAWIFDNWRRHSVGNPASRARIHLVFDTVGTGSFWQLAQADSPPTRIPVDAANGPPRLLFEAAEDQEFRGVAALAAELELLHAELREAGLDPESLLRLRRFQQSFLADWRAIAVAEGDSPRGGFLRQDLCRQYRHALGPTAQALLPNGVPLADALDPVLAAAARQARPPAPTGQTGAAPPRTTAPASAPRPVRTADTPRFDRPLFLVAAPRSGSSYLFDLVSQLDDAWTIGGESHRHIEGIAGLHPRDNGFLSNALGESHATADVRAKLMASLARDLRNPRGERWAMLGDEHRPTHVRFVEKTPKNALRIPFLTALFPDARFLFLIRRPGPSLSSMIEAWRSGRFVTYPQLPGWSGTPWSLLLVPGWQQLVGRDLAEIAARQWQAANSAIARDLAALGQDRSMLLDHDSMVADPVAATAAIARFAGLADPVPARLKAVGLSRHTVSAPSPDKWLRDRDRIGALLAPLEALYDQLVGGKAGTADPGPALWRPAR